MIYYKINYKNDEGLIEKLICKTEPDDNINTMQDLCEYWKEMIRYNFKSVEYPQFAIAEITEQEYNAYKEGYLDPGDYIIYEEFIKFLGGLE